MKESSIGPRSAMPFEGDRFPKQSQAGALPGAKSLSACTPDRSRLRIDFWPPLLQVGGWRRVWRRLGAECGSHRIRCTREPAAAAAAAAAASGQRAGVSRNKLLRRARRCPARLPCPVACHTQEQRGRPSPSLPKMGTPRPRYAYGGDQLAQGLGAPYV
ncbi:hypothetical protein PAL_GLEAN10007785 [Pteropus alecto]|uniref:Uncharacterized protein n=1 Tax=Pteropus alecto TaxID=9402 RepID=L5KEY6_PTEAL|nr:hypothetical protein PAL_GLEAN10007785 [Pteropus alecto]